MHSKLHQVAYNTYIILILKILHLCYLCLIVSMFYRQGHTSHQRLRPFSLKYDEVNPCDFNWHQSLWTAVVSTTSWTASSWSSGKTIWSFSGEAKTRKKHGGSGEVEVEATIPNLSTSPRLQQEWSLSQGMLPKGASKEAEMQYIPVRDAQEGLSYMMCLWFLWLGEKTGEMDSAGFSCTESLSAYCRLNRTEFARASRPSSTK